MSINDKSIPLPMYNGKEEEYLVWKSRMEGFATSKGIWIAVVQKDELPATEATILDATNDAVAIRVKQANGLLMAYLMNAFKRLPDTKMVMNIKAKNKSDWPSGKAHLVFEGFDKKYNPKDLQTDIELENKLSALSMKRGDDPC